MVWYITVQHSVAPYSVAPYSIAKHSIAKHSIAQPSIAQPSPAAVTARVSHHASPPSRRVAEEQVGEEDAQDFTTTPSLLHGSSHFITLILSHAIPQTAQPLLQHIAHRFH